jgi:hypothetical protein
MPASQVLTARIPVPRLLIWRHGLPALSFNLHTVGIGRATTLVLSVEARPSRPGPPGAEHPGIASFPGSASAWENAKKPGSDAGAARSGVGRNWRSVR